MTAGSVFHRVMSALEQAGIQCMVTGSFASSYHGSPRSTQDIDIVVDATEVKLRSFVRSLPAEEYYVDETTALEALREETQFNVIDIATGWKIDLIILKSRAFSREEFERRTLADLDGERVAIVTAEDLIVAKLEWSRAGGSLRQVEDVASIMRIRGAELDIARIERWVSQMGLDVQWQSARRAAGI